MSRQEPRVIGISAPAGGGKTTLVQALANRLDEATIIAHDDYAGLAQYPDDMGKWVAGGADFNRWQLPQLAEALARLKAGAQIVHPLTGARVEPGAIILFEAPLGYAHHATGQHIDFLVFIDTPLEIALARWLMSRLPESGNGPAILNGQPVPVRHLLQSYLTQLRPIYLIQRERVRSGADLVLNGERDPEALADAVWERVGT